ncbi:MAG TPA: hypothetical protein VHP64_01975 [Candidatus Limnocylindria bacterium]|jgi:hypothetical protein|nr:hypothetical protein [Candidatus Limnocylindria bacterium]
MRRVLILMAMALLLAACVEDTRPQGEACEAPSIELALTLSEDGLQPASPSVCRDQEVTLAITSSVDGVIHIHGYDEWVPATEVVSGENLELTFTAERSGQFPIEMHPADDPQGVELGVFTVHEP